MRNETDYQEEGGVVVKEVEKGSPAAKAGIKKRDIIIGYGGQPIDDKQDLMQHIHASPVGEEILITVWRDDQKKEIPVKLIEIDVGSAYLKQKQRSKEVNQSIIRSIGLGAMSLGPDYGINGVRVTSVLKESLSDNKIRKGDIIFQINNNPIYHAAHLKQLLLTLAPVGSIKLYIIRDGRKLPDPIELPQVNKS